MFLLQCEYLFSPPNFTLAARLLATSEGMFYCFYRGFSQTDVPSSQYTGKHRCNQLFANTLMVVKSGLDAPFSTPPRRLISVRKSTISAVISSPATTIGLPGGKAAMVSAEGSPIAALTGTGGQERL